MALESHAPASSHNSAAVNPASPCFKNRDDLFFTLPFNAVPFLLG
jgi:hypothetical protein